MATFSYASPAGRINKVKGEILAHAMPVEVLGLVGMHKQIPKNSGDNVVFRRYLPFGAAATNQDTINRPLAVPANHVLTEGSTPTADSLLAQDITATLVQYGALYSWTDKAEDLYEDDVPAEAKKQLGERIGLVREMVRWGGLTAGTNVYYGGTGSSVATVNGEVSINLLRKVSRNLQANHAKRITSILAPSAMFNTTPVEASYVVFCHSDLEASIRDIPGFKHVAEYGQRKPLSEFEIGSVENFRFITSPELASTPNAATSVTASTFGLFTTGGTNPDVYRMIVTGEDAWGDVALRGTNSMDVKVHPASHADKNDLLGQRGYAGAKFYMTMVLLNQGHFAVVNVGAKAL
jgi:N4-gp56 family major capsid protein